MDTAIRYPKNPVLGPLPAHPWEQVAAFNGCPILADDGCHLLYRAQSSEQAMHGKKLEVSTIGHAVSFDRVSFLNRRQFIVPEHPWEQFGCEDPRVTCMDGVFYIFYTAISTWPPTPDGISVGLATTTDFFTVSTKHHITPFNAKAMTMFPRKIQGKIAVLLTANSDKPPSTIGLALLDSEETLWDKTFWSRWYASLPNHALPLLRNDHDHVEIGAPPIETAQGWLLIYSYIKSYKTSHKFFGIEAVLLDHENPKKIIKRTPMPILYPEFEYELEGNIPNIVFPSGALVHNDTIGVYYGACDTVTCLATIGLKDVLEAMRES